MSLFYDIDGNKRPKTKIIIFFVIIPIIFSLISLKLDKANEIIDTLLACLSIFTALIFTVLFVVPDKLSSRINMLKEKDDDATHGYLIRFYNFTKSFVQQMSFVIVLSLTLIILVVLHCVRHLFQVHRPYQHYLKMQHSQTHVKLIVGHCRRQNQIHRDFLVQQPPHRWRS